VAIESIWSFRRSDVLQPTVHNFVECDNRSEAKASTNFIHLGDQRFVLRAFSQLEDRPVIRVKKKQNLLLISLAFLVAFFPTQAKDFFQYFVSFVLFIDL